MRAGFIELTLRLRLHASQLRKHRNAQHTHRTGIGHFPAAGGNAQHHFFLPLLVRCSSAVPDTQVMMFRHTQPVKKKEQVLRPALELNFDLNDGVDVPCVNATSTARYAHSVAVCRVSRECSCC